MVGVGVQYRVGDLPIDGGPVYGDPQRDPCLRGRNGLLGDAVMKITNLVGGIPVPKDIDDRIGRFL